MLFSDLALSEPLLRALAAEGYATPTPIQAQAIPPILEGRDLLGSAQTGTGKTAAFALPVLHRLALPERTVPIGTPDPEKTGTGTVSTRSAIRDPRSAASSHRTPRVLVLSPTRELASQIADSFRTYGCELKFRYTVVFGGTGQHPQVQSLRSGCDILIATPGRLIDLMQQGHVDLSRATTFVLDEADTMLDMGFIHAIRQITPHLPAQRQNLMFSATMPPEIRKLASTILKNPVTVQCAPTGTSAANIDQTVYFVDRPNKPHLLNHFLTITPFSRAIVFTRTKHGADRVARQLEKAGIKSEAIHGNKNQNARRRALQNFKSDNPPVLVATDVAARGLDIDDVSHVINYDVPEAPETYIHRIGRTARAGASGMSISFCDKSERNDLKSIERLTKKTLRVLSDHPPYPARHDQESRTDAPAPRPANNHPHRQSRTEQQHHREQQQRDPQQQPQPRQSHPNAPRPHANNRHPAAGKPFNKSRPRHHAHPAPSHKPRHPHRAGNR